MEELKENINPFTINGYLGRKWYFILGLTIAAIMIILQLTLCSSLFKEVVNMAQNDVQYSIIEILRSGKVAQSQVIAYTIIFTCGLIFSFINNKKRFTDLTGKEKNSYILTSLISISTLLMAFAVANTTFYGFVTLITTIAGMILLLMPGKLVITPYKEPVETIDGKVDAKTIVSFWRRWGAYVIDASFLLAPVSLFTSMMFSRQLYNLGNYSIIFGFILFLLYFGIMNSKITKGQTLGKTALQVKVVDKDGNCLSVSKSFLRAFIFTLCVMMPIAFLNMLTIQQTDYTLKLVITIFMGLGLIFDCLFLFNLKTRQTIHDLFAGSYVVTDKSRSALNNYKTSFAPIIFAIIPGLFLGLLMYAGFTAYNTQSRTNENVIENIYLTENIEKTFDTKIVRTAYTDPALYKQEGPKVYSIFVNVDNIKNEELAQNIGKYILNSEYKDKVDTVNVILQKSINMGNIVNSKLKTYKVAK